MTEVAITNRMSQCNLCGAMYQSAPVGVIHKCGSCSGGRCYPIADAIDAQVLVCQPYLPTLSSLPEDVTQNFSSLPTYVSAFQNKQIQEIVRATLNDANIAVDDDVVDKISHDLYTKLRNRSLI